MEFTWTPDDLESKRITLAFLSAHNVSWSQGSIMWDILFQGRKVLVLHCAGLPDIVIEPGERFRLSWVKRDAVQPVNGCRWCGLVDREHPNLWTFRRGYHRWEAPTDDTRKARLKLQRQLRALAVS